jgi:hypothetical protein
MAERKKKKESVVISRREFLKDASLLVGGAALGSTSLLAACGGGTNTVTEAPSSFEATVHDPSGAHEILAIFAERVGDLNGKKVAGLAADPTKWQTHRTFPYIFDLIRERYPQVEIIPQTSFTMGTAINDDEVALAVLESGADVCVIGNAA